MPKDVHVGRSVVLIIEDDAFLIKIYQVRFRAEGIDVWTATDGSEALSFLVKEPPNIVLLDLMLPNVSGWDVLIAVRKNDKWKSVPVIILSNLGQPEDIERGKELGATDYIVKANVRINDVVERAKKFLMQG